ncbi:restriction endonuclease subunit S [Allisonella histaminiformans]|uniref:restriction endonuclease subunit S n=1 Tax=Allisonella histaminiformans TaxID=209880 RepID=UPI002E7768EF|nr:restriction endonuclease subunit S [Allisonella histaminiformans]
MNTTKLKNVCVVVSGTTPKSTDKRYWNGTHVWITPAELSEDSFIVTDSERHITDEAIKATGLKSFPKGTVLLSSRAPIGKVAIAGCEMYCNQGFKNLICSESIYNLYLYYFLKSKTAYLNSLGRGATFKEISKGIVEDISIPFPVYSEQIRIAKQLQKISELISLKKGQYRYFDDIIRSRFIEMFGDPIINPFGYPIHKLGEYIEFLTSGSRGWAQYYADDGNDWFITIKNVKNCKIMIDNMQTINAPKNAEAKRTKVKEGDLLISITADLGRTGIVTKEIEDKGAYINQHLSCIRLNRHVLEPLYVAYFMESKAGKKQFIKENQSAVKAGINFKSIQSLKLIVPPLAMQKKFLLFFTEVDKSKYQEVSVTGWQGILICCNI